jgi:hypothetical protein
MYSPRMLLALATFVLILSLSLLHLYSWGELSAQPKVDSVSPALCYARASTTVDAGKPPSITWREVTTTSWALRVQATAMTTETQPIAACTSGS